MASFPGKYVLPGDVVGIACAIVVVIFMVQSVGTGRIVVMFAPIVLIYFLCNLIVESQTSPATTEGYTRYAMFPVVLQSL